MKKPSLERAFPWLLIIAGFIGLICSFIITVDKMKLLENPAFKPNCDLNPIISCGSVMNSKQSHIFDFSNSIIGLAAFPVLITIGIASLAGAKFKAWFWRGLVLGGFLGVVFVHWLAFQSLYRIHSLCPYCMVVWVVTITTFWYSLLYSTQQGYIKVSKKYEQLAGFARRHHLDILVLWLLIILALILNKFWYYYGPKLGF